MPARIPDQLAVGTLRFRVYRLGDGRLAFDYKRGSKRVVVKRRTLEALRAEAERIATGILNAETAALDVTAEDRRIYIAAAEIVRPLALRVDEAARLLSQAATLAGGVGRILDACRWHAQAMPTRSDATTAEVVAHFLRHLKSESLSAIYIARLEADLHKFAARFPSPIADVRAADLGDWLADLAVGAVRRRKLRDQLLSLFTWARDHGYLPESLRTEPEKVKRPKVVRKAPALYTPAELDLLLQQCSAPAEKRSGRKDYADFLPAIAIGAFAGLRWAEIQRLDWSHIHWQDGVIEVGEENKTGYRLVPIQPNLATWLHAFRGRRGLVCPFPRPDNIIRRLGMRAGLPVGGRRYSNALRHSCVTYRVAVTKNMPQVATESGHSVTELRRRYHRASLESVAQKWFAIARETSANVLQMPLGMFASR